MTKIVPALLVKSLEEYKQKLKVVRQLTDRMQLDVIDGQFVDNQTIAPADIEKLPDIKIDAHLMVEDPLTYARQCVKLGCYTTIVQFESSGDASAAIEHVKDNGLRAGVAINPSTQAEDIEKLLPTLDHVLVMAYPAGFAGQPFDKKNLKKIIELKEMKASLEIGWDGAVDEETVGVIAKAGADVINVNSYLFAGTDVLERYSKLLGALS